MQTNNIYDILYINKKFIVKKVYYNKKIIIYHEVCDDENASVSEF